MATPQDFTVRARDEMYNIYVHYQSLNRRILDLSDEVTALGVEALYGAGGATFPAQADGFTYADMVAAFMGITSLIGEPTLEQKQAVIKARRG